MTVHITYVCVCCESHCSEQLHWLRGPTVEESTNIMLSDKCMKQPLDRNLDCFLIFRPLGQAFGVTSASDNLNNSCDNLWLGAPLRQATYGVWGRLGRHRCKSLFKFLRTFSQINPRVRKISSPQFWGRKWLRQFEGHLEKLRSFSMPIKFLVLGGGGIFAFFWGAAGVKKPR